ncbi:ThiF family adenylyltransferase [Pseudalkalibacillus caeni]|uniref:Thiazole biosynthesis adenylyltransferase ThiF n=1 Tax=Exobacillus caeni TaxID=2574798 RepID=A0A5R9F9D6_9BACL|nr:ThiF family adenylyltransferase [Pseudalkalibacillus caeni]TLS36315.1 thiazole biosynthesis adenylyltransferase ThiF [Pseudalkalibacillus caeni]
MVNDFQRYSRQMLFKPIGKTGQEKLGRATVLIVGMGALGTVLASQLVRAGIGHVRFADRDYVEKSNLQRQMLFDEEDVKKALPKAVAAKEKLSKMNSEIEIEGIVCDVSTDNIEELLQDVDIVVDGTDNFGTRFLINDACFKHNIPYVYGGAVSSRGMTALFIPGQTPCLRCFISHDENAGDTCDTVGVIAPVVDIVASYQVVEVLKYLVEDEKNRRNSLMTFDVWNNYSYNMKFSKPKKDCPTCQLHQYPALENNGNRAVTSLCGRETVQIKVRESFNIDDWAKKLSTAGKVKKTPFLVKVELEEGERLVVFPDGRVLVQGTEDIGRARSLYARYIGM